VNAGRSPQRIGIVFVGFEKANLAAFKYLLLQLNGVQSSFEYEILPTNPDPFCDLLKASHEIDRALVKEAIPEFADRYSKQLAAQIAESNLSEAPPDYFIVVSLARLTGEFYTTRRKNVSVLALGNWERAMAPPSILEFIVTLVVRESVASVSAALAGSVHLGTKGCVCDFTDDIGEARLKVLSGFVCAHCSRGLAAEGHVLLADEIRTVLKKAWLGRSDDVMSPAATVAKLGYDLFVIKGLKATTWERTMTTIRDEGIKQMLAVIAAVIGGAILVWLGLKSRSG
jgi:hypothetical protein